MRAAALIGAWAATLVLVLAAAVEAAGPEGALDGRAWELVSPPDKNGGEVAFPAEAGAGGFRAAVGGGAFAFASAASFGAAEGAAPHSQYLATRGADGWSTENLTPAHLSGAYAGNPYLAFSSNLASSLYLNPSRCPAGDPCPPGYQLRDTLSAALLASPPDPGLFAGASDDLRRLVFQDGTDLRLWSPPAPALSTVNATPAAALAAPEGAVSADGQRIYWRGEDGNLYLRAGGETRQVDADAGGGGSFQAASQDGQIAFFTLAGHLHRYDAATETSADLTPSGGVATVLGASDDGSELYYRAASGLFRWRQGKGAQQIPSPTNPSDASPASSGVSADGQRLFLTTAKALVLTDTNKAPDAYQWQAQGVGGCQKASGCFGLLSSGRVGSATFLGASAEGADAFFITDASLLPADTGGADVYDARAGGGFAEPAPPIPCLGDACQGPAGAPDAIVPASALLSGRGNPAPSRVRKPRRCAKRKRAGSAKRKRCAKGKRPGRRRGRGRVR